MLLVSGERENLRARVAELWPLVKALRCSEEAE